MAKVNHDWSSGKMSLEDVGLDSLRQATDHEKQENNQDENNKLPSAYEMWKNFVDATSLHGIRYVFWRRPLWARIGWLVVLLVFAAYFLFTAYESITKYYRRPLNTVVTQKYEDRLDFPAVTICPLNLVSKKKMFALDGDADFVKYGLNDSFCVDTASVRGGKPCGAAMMCCCVTFLLFDGAKIVPNCTSQYATSLIAAQQSSGSYFDTGRYYKKYSQGINEMLVPDWCVFDANLEKPCGVSDFTTTLTDFGICHTFNAGPDNIKQSHLDGAGGGLNILLNAEIEDHTIGRLSEGFSVIIHRQGDFFIPWDGISVAPGTQGSITLHQQRIINLESPYETKCEDKKLKTFRSYTKNGCLYECTVEAVIKNCKCSTADYAAAPTVRTCAKYDTPCVQETFDSMEPTKSCDCPVPCNEIRYTTEVHYSQFPDAGSATVLQAQGVNVSFEYMRKNFVFLQVGYKSISYELHEQQVAFGSEALFGEIGGNMGLFLGCSLMTVFEFADLLVALIFVRKLNREYQT